jgi:ABC-type nitrate/sulfonate/bicarbonate transport system substrate-binding protein
VISTRREFFGTDCLAASAVVLGATGCRTSSSSLPASSRNAIDIVMTLGSTGLYVNEVARSQHFFEDFNLTPNVIQVSDGGKCIAALLGGSAKIARSGFNQLTPAIEKGAGVKIISGGLDLPSVCLYSANPSVKSVKDLEGKSIGTGAIGSVLYTMTVLLLRKHGVNIDNVTFRNFGSNPDVFKAIVAKTVDAGLGDVEMFDLQEKFGVHALPDGMTWKEIPDYTNQGIYATNDAIQNNRDLLIRVLAAHAKTYRFICSPDSKDVFMKAHQKATGVTDPQEALSEWNWIQANQPFAKDLVLSDDRINFIQKLNVEFKNQLQVLPIATVADMSLASEALSY